MKPPCQPWSSMMKRITGTRSEAPSKKPISTRLRAMPRRASNQRETKVWKGIKNHHLHKDGEQAVEEVPLPQGVGCGEQQVAAARQERAYDDRKARAAYVDYLADDGCE